MLYVNKHKHKKGWHIVIILILLFIYWYPKWDIIRYTYVIIYYKLLNNNTLY